MTIEEMPPRHAEATIRRISCGSCQWYSSGYNGETCRITRDVEVLTSACVEFQPIFEDPYHDASTDKFIAGIRKKLLSNYFIIDKEILLEAKGYIINLESIIDGMGRNAEFNFLNSALKKIVAYRARITEIMSNCIELQSKLEQLVDQANMWIYSKYEIFRELRNEKQRQAGFDRIIPEYSSVKTSLDILTKTVELIDKKIGQNEYTIRAILDANVKMVYSTDRIKS